MQKRTEGDMYDIGQVAEIFQQQISKRLGLQQELAEQLDDKSKECQRVADLVEKLLEKPHHQVMVPLGKFALIPGELIHTNDYMVKLGQDTFVHRSASQTSDILNRRKIKLDNQRSEIEEQMSKLKQKLQDFQSVVGEEGLIDIQERYDEEVHGSSEAETASPFKSTPDTPQVESKKTQAEQQQQPEELISEDDFMKLMSRIEELEVQENEEEHLRNKSTKNRISSVMDNKDGQQNGVHSTPFMKHRPPIPKQPSSKQTNQPKQQLTPPPSQNQVKKYQQSSSSSSSPQQESRSVAAEQQQFLEDKNFRGQNKSLQKQQDTKIGQSKKQQASKQWSSKGKQNQSGKEGDRFVQKDGGMKKGFLAKQSSETKSKHQGGFSSQVIEHKPSVHTISEPVNSDIEKQQKVKNIAARWEVTDNNDQQAEQQETQKPKKQSRFKQMLQEGK